MCVLARAGEQGENSVFSAALIPVCILCALCTDEKPTRIAFLPPINRTRGSAHIPG